MKAKVICSMVALLLSAFALAGVAEAAEETTVTIKGPQGDFSGKVKSTEACTAERTVKVFKKTPDGKTNIGSDTSDSNGSWSIGNSGYKNGRFFARAVKSEGCEAGTSNTIRLVDGVQQ